MQIEHPLDGSEGERVPVGWTDPEGDGAGEGGGDQQFFRVEGPSFQPGIELFFFIITSFRYARGIGDIF